MSSVGSGGVGCGSPWARSWGSATEGGEPLRKQLQPLVLCHAREGEENTFELLLNLLLGSLRN